jgi:hypothetical protein
MSQRKLLSQNELNAHLTREIRKVEDLEDATLRMTYVLRAPDESGCNWSSDYHLNVGSKGSVPYAQPHAKAIIDAARATYNVTS